MNHEVLDNNVLLKIKWKNKPRLIAFDLEDFEKFKHIKWSYYQYGDFVGYHVKEATKQRVRSLASVILNTNDAIIHLNRNSLDNRKCNLLKKSIGLIIEPSRIQTMIDDWNKLIEKSSFSKEAKETHYLLETVVEPIIVPSKPAPKVKELKFDFELDETIKPYLHYTKATTERSDYFYLVDHPVVLDKLKKRRLQGTKSQSLSTEDKYLSLIKVIEDLVE